MEKNEVAVFGGGCFWCTEAVFRQLKGVSEVSAGYAGGTTEHPAYEQVSGGHTGHAECIHVAFDPTLVSYRTLLTVFFGSHNPTTPNRQGADVGTQYRSVVFYTTPEQKTVYEELIKELNNSSTVGDPIVTQVEPLTTFYKAENYHQDYFAKNPDNRYCELVINPKLEHLQKDFADILVANK